MKLALIVPATQENLGKHGKAICPPLGLATVAALTPPGIDITLIDENVMPVDFNSGPDLVGITTLTITAHRAYQIADKFRQNRARVVLGGSHASALPEEAGKHADAVVIGEAEGLWPAVIEDFRNNRLQKTYRQKERPDLSNLPLPRRDLYARDAYYFTNTISTSRGCPFACSFCSVTSFFGRTYRFRPVADILREIDTLPDRKLIGFVDDNLFGNPQFAKELLRALKPYKLKWVAEASVNIAKDDEMLRLAAESGCLALLLGLETLSPANLGAVGKKVNRVEEYEANIRKIHSYGIAVHCFFIFGLDEDDTDVFDRTVRFARKTRLETASFSLLVPYPGTGLYDSLDAAGRILTKDWSQYEFNPVFQPLKMSPETLKEGYYQAWRNFYTLPSIFGRIGPLHRSQFLFWAGNLALRSSWKHRHF